MKEDPEYIDRFEIVERLGEGGMGIVYLAYDSRLKRPIALKTGRIGETVDQKTAERLIEEAQLMAALDHPNITKIFDADISEGIAWVAMEQVKGRTLNDWKMKMTPGKEELLGVIGQVGDALSYAHQRGIIHRDVKPNNIMIANQDGKVVAKLLDFGIAQIFSRTKEDHLQSVGSWQYMSPEQKAHRKVTKQSDIYMLAKVFIELLGGDTTPEVSTESIRNTNSSTTLEDTGLPNQSQANKILIQAIKAAPTKRPKRASIFAKDLLEALESLPFENGCFVFESKSKPGNSVHLLQVADLAITGGSPELPFNSILVEQGRSSIHALVVCGNVLGDAESSRAVERAHASLSCLVTSPRVILIPGPSDVSKTKTREAVGDLFEHNCERPPHKPSGDDVGFQRDIYRQKLDGFASIFDQISGLKWETDWKKQFFLFKLVQPAAGISGVVVVALNSACLITHENENREELDKEVLMEVPSILAQRFPHSQWRRILVFHLANSTLQSALFSQGLELLFKQVDLVLHGGCRPEAQKPYYFYFNTLVVPVPPLQVETSSDVMYNILQLDLATDKLTILPFGPGRDRQPIILTLKPESKPSCEHQPKLTIKYIDRDVQVIRDKYFSTVLDVVEQRKFCFVIGGLNSGRKTFLQQFETYLKELRGNYNYHILEFNWQVLESFQESLKLLESEDYFVPQLELNSLFATLAWPAFQMLNQVDTPFRDWPRSQMGKINERSFLQMYMNDRKLLMAEAPTECLEFFLLFLRECNERELTYGGAKNSVTRLTVFMPFEQFETLFQKDREPVTKKLWGALCSYARGYEDSSRSDPSMTAQQISRDIGVLISLPCVTLGIDAAQGKYLKNAVLQVPPLSREELSEFGQKIYGFYMDDRLVDAVMHHTGGLPWFVKLTLICLTADHSVASKPWDEDWFNGALEHAKSLVRQEYGLFTPGLGLDSLRDEISQYYQTLDLNLQTANAFEDNRIFQAWKAGTRIASTGRLKSWVATGLVIPRNKYESKESVFIFDAYPRIWFARAAALPLHLFESWKKSRSHIGEP